LLRGSLKDFYKEFINLSTEQRLIAGHFSERPLYFIVSKIVINFTMFIVELTKSGKRLRVRKTNPKKTALRLNSVIALAPAKSTIPIVPPAIYLT
jgi:hypothetical protein